jgi:hypothetical protein
MTALAAMSLAPLSTQDAFAEEARTFDVSVGAQYDTTHVYIAPVTTFAATFGGKPSKRAEGNVLPVPSHAALQYVWTPVGTLSVFGFDTPIPFPFGSERSGYLAISATPSSRRRLLAPLSFLHRTMRRIDSPQCCNFQAAISRKSTPQDRIRDVAARDGPLVAASPLQWRAKLTVVHDDFRSGHIAAAAQASGR